jgi:hypothetical protein
MRTKTKIRAEVHLPCRSRTPDDILVGRGIDEVPDDSGCLCIKRPKECCIESEQQSVDEGSRHTRGVSPGEEIGFRGGVH